MSLIVSLFFSSGTPEEIIGTSQFLLLVAHFVFNAVFDKFFISVLHMNEPAVILHKDSLTSLRPTNFG